MKETKLIRNPDLNATYPGNPDKSSLKKDSEERKPLTPIVTGKVVKKEKSWGRKFVEVFVGDDSTTVRDYILYDIIVPAVKNTLTEAVTGGLEILLFGEQRGKGGRTIRDRDRSYVSYSSSYDNVNNRHERGRGDRSARARHDFDDIVFESRKEAEDVLTHLSDLAMDYGFAKVADFYELSGLESEYTDNQYGWSTLRDAHTERVRGGYAIRLPRTRPID